MVKGTHWSYEQEWRFKIAALSFEAQFPDDEYFNNVTLDLETYPVEAEALFIPLAPTAINEIEVMIGPKADGATRKEVERILGEYAPSATLTHSLIKIR